MYAGIDCVSLPSLTFRVCTNKECLVNKNKTPKRYIINKNATILFWNDGTKTIVKKSDNDTHDKRLAFLTAYFQKNSGLTKNKANKYLDGLKEE